MTTSEPRFDLLAQAEQLAREHGLEHELVVDADAHHSEPLADLLPYLPELARQRIGAKLGQAWYMVPYDVGDQQVGGRIKRPRRLAARSEVAAAARRMGVGYSILYPSDLLNMGLSPQAGIETALAEAYARWLAEAVLPAEPTIRAMIYLPLGDVATSVRLVDGYADHPGVAGFVVPAVQHHAIHSNAFVPLYEALDAHDAVLAFHPVAIWRERQFEIFSSLASVNAMTPAFYNLIQALNLIVHGIPERFPRLRLVFCEAGLSWLMFLMNRLDNEYQMRPSEAPLLRRLPSEYLRDCFFTTQPLEQVEPRWSEALFRTVGTDHLLYASNFPRWDFDLPGRIGDLAFLDAEQRRDILGRNAARLFRLPDRGQG